MFESDVADYRDGCDEAFSATAPARDRITPGRVEIQALTFFSSLLATRSIRRTRDALGISSPAASQYLAQIRKALNDPVVSGDVEGELVFTAQAEALAPALQDTLLASQRLFGSSLFEPAQATRIIRIAADPISIVTVVIPLARHLTTAAPGLSLEVETLHHSHAADLANGRLDFVIDTEQALLPGVKQRPIYRDTLAAVVRNDHPVLSKYRAAHRYGVQELIALPRTILALPATMWRSAGPHVALGDRPEKSAFLMADPMAAALTVVDSDRLMTVPRRLAGLLTRSLPLSLLMFADQEGFDTRITWSDSSTADSFATWLRDQLYLVVSRSETEVAARVAA